MSKKLLLVSAMFASLALVSVASAQRVVAAKAIDRANFDTTCAACDDFFTFANGGWVKRTSIPPDKTALGSFGILADKNNDVVHAILGEAAAAVANGTAQPGTNTFKIGAYYASCMDSAAIEAAGARPIQPRLAAIAAIMTTDDLVLLFGQREGARGGLAPFALGPGQDPKDNTSMIVSAGQGGLGLPNTEYYTRTDAKSAETRQLYVDHVARTLMLVGETAGQAKADARTIMALETAIAGMSMTRVQMRDPNSTYNKMALADFQALTPHINWTRYLDQAGAKGGSEVNVRQPQFFKALDGMLSSVPLDDWKAYLRWRTANGAAGTLSSAFVNESFKWQQSQSGAQEQQPRWRRCLTATNVLGEAVGEEYVKRNFSPEAKARAVKIVDNLIVALRERISQLDWMSGETKTQALAKLDAFGRKIAYPDKWRDYSALQVKAGAYFENTQLAGEWQQSRSWARLGKPVDHSEWGMTPPTVNASYSPLANEITFPAGILQSPFFDPNADDAVNYGAMGAVIGHEMTHGFDDQGRQYDAKGNLRDWWTPADAVKYKAAAQLVSDQFDGFTVVDDQTHVNGKTTLGENIADLGGLTVAFSAMEKALGSGPRAAVDGFTPEQRFFLGYAQIWREVRRQEALRQQVNTDPHAPAKWRVNGPLSNMPEFRAAWGCKDGEKMVRPATLRARIW